MKTPIALIFAGLIVGISVLLNGHLDRRFTEESNKPIRTPIDICIERNLPENLGDIEVGQVIDNISEECRKDPSR